MRFPSAILPILVASTLSTKAQSVKPLIDSQNYVFIAVSAQPMGRAERRLTINTYSLRITKGKISCNLPYEGNVNTANTDLLGSALVFTSDKFKYNVSPGRKDGWIVKIRPKDTPNLDELKLTITADGYTIAHASFNGLDPITFIGTISAPDSQ